MTDTKLDAQDILNGPTLSFVKDEQQKAKGWEELVKRVTYRPGYHLEAIYEIDFDITKLIVQATVENTYRRGQMIPIIFQSNLPLWRHMRDDKEAMSFIREALHDMERHESDEWIRLDGEMIFDPHAMDDTFKKAGI